MRIYTITEPSGRKTAIMAKSRTEAIGKFLAETGMPLDFFQEKLFNQVNPLAHASKL